MVIKFCFLVIKKQFQAPLWGFLICLISVSGWAKENTVIIPNNIENVRSKFTIERVIDGDTFIASGRTIRLWGIDAPEKNNPLHWLSTELLRGILNNKEQLLCKFIEKDQYQRNVMHCLSGNLDIGSMMVQMGMAKDYSKYSGDYYQYEEDLAKKHERGIWIIK